MIDNRNIDWAKDALKDLNPNDKFGTMLYVAAIITALLKEVQIQPIIVGGFSVEIYTGRDYSTRDIDIVTNERDTVIQKFIDLGFTIEGRHLVHRELDVAIEFPDEELAGSYDKINKIIIDDANDLYIYVISYEDIIMDRLRAYLYWGEHESKEWGMRLLFRYINKVDQLYLKTVGQGAENKQESDEISNWINEIERMI